MKDAKRKTGGAVWTAFAVSLVVHLAAGAAVMPILRPTPDVDDSKPKTDAETEEPEPLQVKVVPEQEEPEPKKRRPEPREKKKREERKEREKDKEKKRREQKQPQKRYNRKAVVQETNEESPEEAEFVSEKANKTDEQTRARETSKDFVEPSKTSSNKEREAEETKESPEEKLGSRVVASKARPKPKRRPRERRPREQREQKRRSNDRKAEKTPEKKGPKPSPKRQEKSSQNSASEPPREPLPMPRLSDYDKIFDEEEDRRRRRRHAEKGVGHDMYKRIEKSKGSVKAAMENYIPEVKPGNHTSVNAHADKAAAYVNRIHSKIHPRWGGRYLPHLDTTYGPGHPLSDPDLNAVLEFVIDGKTGELEKVTIVSSSGVTSYDMEAVLISQHVAPHTKPPSEIVSPDGNVYMHWNFWRDQRQCGTFGVSVYKVDGSGS